MKTTPGRLARVIIPGLLTLLAGTSDGADVSIPRRFVISADNAPFFPIGLYTLPQGGTDQPSAAAVAAMRQEAKAAGFNFLVGQDAGPEEFARSFDIPGGPPDPDAKTRRGSLLDLAHQIEQKKGLLLELVEKHEKTPGVIVWQGPDEPNDFPFGIRPGPSAQGLAAGANILRSRSKHPLWINFSPTGDHIHPNQFDRLLPYLAIPDIVSVDIYPVGGGSDLQESPFAERGPACVGVFTRNLARMVSRDGVQQKPVWMVLQAFGWGDLAKMSTPPEKWTGRTPTLAEVRFMAFDAIINGAGGVIFWGARYLPPNDPNATWASLKSVASEISSLLPILTAEHLPADHVVAPSHPAVEVAVRRSGDRVVILLANTSSSEIETSLAFHQIKVKRLKPLGLSTNAGSRSPGDSIRFRPLEVRILEVELER